MTAHAKILLNRPFITIIERDHRGKKDELVTLLISDQYDGIEIRCECPHGDALRKQIDRLDHDLKLLRRVLKREEGE